MTLNRDLIRQYVQLLLLLEEGPPSVALERRLAALRHKMTALELEHALREAGR